MAYPRIKLADNSGNEVAVTSNALDVNIASGDASIDIGDVSLLFGGTAASVDEGNADSGTLRVTLADDDNLLNAVIGTDGLTGPVKALSIGGTTNVGSMKELLVDATGHLQVDVVTAASTAVTNAGTFATQIDGDALTALEKIDDIQDAIGTDGDDPGPSKCISIGGTESDGTLQEIRVDELGRLQIELAVFEPGATGAAACLAKIDSETYDTASAGIMSKVVCSTTLAALTDVGDGEITSLQVNGDGALYVDGSDSTQPISGTVTANVSGATIASYPQFDVDTSAFALSSASGIDSAVTTAKEIIIQCGFTNTGYIVVGDSGLVAAEGVDSMDGIRLEAGDTLTLAATTTANVYLRGSANDQLVNVMIIS